MSTMAGVGIATGAAKRRRERRLRQWHRHERMTVAMALAEATHHAAPRRQTPVSAIREEVENVTHARLRAQKSPPPGVRPGILPERGPQRSDRTVRRFAGAALPTLGLPVLAGALGEQVDSSTLRFLTAAALKAKRKLEEEEKEKAKMKKLREEMEAAEHEEKMLELNRRIQADLPQSAAERSAWRQWIPSAPAASSSSSKRKKRRKRRTPRTSSCPCGRARRRQRRWLLHGCSVFPSVDDWPLMLGIMAGLDQKDSLPVRRHPFRAANADPHGLDYSADHRVSPVAVRYWLVMLVAMHLALFSFPRFTGPWCSASWSVWTGRQLLWHVKAGYAGYDAPRAVVFFLVRRPMMLGIIAGMDQKDSCCGMYRLVMPVSMHLAQCSFSWFSGPSHDAPHHGRYGPEGHFRALLRSLS